MLGTQLHEKVQVFGESSGFRSLCFKISCNYVRRFNRLFCYADRHVWSTVYSPGVEDFHGSMLNINLDTVPTMWWQHPVIITVGRVCYSRSWTKSL